MLAMGVGVGGAGGGSITPGGANTNVQFNNNGAFGGNGSFTYNGSTGAPVVTINATTGGGILNIGVAAGGAPGQLVLGSNQNSSATLSNVNNVVSLTGGNNLLMFNIATGLASQSGTKPTLSGTGACATFGTQIGGSMAGSSSCTSATAASTLTLTFPTTATDGYICYVQDETTRANLFQQTGHTTTSCTLTATSVTLNDVFVYSAMGF